LIFNLRSSGVTAETLAFARGFFVVLAGLRAYRLDDAGLSIRAGTDAGLIQAFDPFGLLTSTPPMNEQSSLR
jgi:hypothetical protein